MVKDEIERELEWAINRPTSRAHLFGEALPLCGNEESGNAKAAGAVPDLADSPVPFEMALNEMEHHFLEGYRLAWPGSACQLNQDPKSGHGHHSSSDYCLFTLISNFGLVWSDHVGRWMFPTEALVCQHFPVVPGLHDYSLELTSFHLPNEARAGRHVFTQVGNSMHCGVMALLQLHSLSEVRYPKVSNLLANIRFARTAMTTVTVTVTLN